MSTAADFHEAMHGATFYEALSLTLGRDDVQEGTNAIAQELVALCERRGRLFVLGVGGGAANAAHAVNDLRKLCGIEAYAPTDGISELTARANDDGWPSVFPGWLKTSQLREGDAILVFSVGGGALSVSRCIYEAVMLAKQVGARMLGVVGKPDGAVAKMGDAVVVTGLEGRLLTPVTETVQVAVLHALVSDPRLQQQETKW